MHRLISAALAASIGLSVSACVQQPERPADCDQPSVSRQATLTVDGLTPRNVDVCNGQAVHLSISIQTDGVLHIHGYDQQTREVRAGQTVAFDFDADHSGQFVIELHTKTAPSGQGMGVFTVHER
ncbi:MAG TPA: hypothetical protein VFM74_01605 [Candidatus Limnocylindria bacterium]|nr:hypothetical protein [Candidatus Limnocylindria bacterium]